MILDLIEVTISIAAIYKCFIYIVFTLLLNIKLIIES